jgi:hypothetical protein
MADGGFSHPVDRGRFVGGGFAWDDELERFSEYDVHRATEAQLVGGFGGVVWDAALKAATLAWQIEPRDIDEDFWFGPITYQTLAPAWETLYPMRSSAPASTGSWRIIRPGGTSGVTYLQQYAATPDEFAFPSHGSLPANPKFCVSLYREWTPSAEEIGAAAAPYIHTGFTFGGIWHLRLVKWRAPELHKRVGGQWQLVATKDWQAQELYGDNYGERETFITVMCIDGQIVMRAGAMGEPWVYAEKRPITVAAAPIELRGNGGACYFGLHGVVFARGEWNLLLGRAAATLDRAPAAAPVSVVTGSKPAGTYARAYLANADGSELEVGPSGPWPRSLRVGVALYSEDGTETPVVRCAGLRVAPVTTAGPQSFLDLTERFMSGDGGWELDLNKHVVKQQYTIRLDNSDGFFDNLRANKLLSIALGRPGSEDAGSGSSWVGDGPAQKLVSVCRIDEKTEESIANAWAQVVTIDRMDILDEIECGERAPQDGMTVAAAIAETLTWGHVRAAEIGAIHDSGARLPDSSWAGEQALGEAGSDVGGMVDRESGAACKPRPELSVWRWLRYLMSFDYNTFMLWDDEGLFQYVALSTAVTRIFRVTDSPAAEDEIRRNLSRRPRLNEGKTSVIVGGRERSTGRPLSSRACDFTALTGVGSSRFRGWDVTEREADESLGEQRLVNLRCRYRFEWLRRLRDVGSYSLIGQRVIPTWRVTVDGSDFYVMSVREQWDVGGLWEMDVDVVAV